MSRYRDANPVPTTLLTDDLATAPTGPVCVRACARGCGCVCVCVCVCIGNASIIIIIIIIIIIGLLIF